MKEKSEKYKLYRKFFLRNIPLYILVVITCLISSCSFGLYAEYNRDDKYMDTNNVIQADVTSISPISHGATSHGYSNNWDVHYEYNDGNYLYQGYITVLGKETAEAYIDNTIDIYIDGQGHSIAVSDYNWRQEIGATKRAFTFGIVSAVCFGVLVFLAVCLFLIKRKKINSLED